jgi:hypothetical protein
MNSIMSHSTFNLITNITKVCKSFGRRVLNYNGQQAKEVLIQENLEPAPIPLLVTNACRPVKKCRYAMLFIITLH